MSPSQLLSAMLISLNSKEHCTALSAGYIDLTLVMQPFVLHPAQNSSSSNSYLKMLDSAIDILNIKYDVINNQ